MRPASCSASASRRNSASARENLHLRGGRHRRPDGRAARQGRCRGVADRARAASGGDAREGPDPALGRGDVHGSPDRHRRPDEPRPPGLCRDHPQGASGAGRGRADAADAGSRDRRGDGRERRALVVLLPPRRPVRGASPAQRRPRRRAVERHRPATRDRLRRLSGGRSARAGCDRAGRGRPLHLGRALGREDRCARSACRRR